MLAWEWTVEKAREGEDERTEKKKTRKISQNAQVGPPKKTPKPPKKHLGGGDGWVKSVGHPKIS